MCRETDGVDCLKIPEHLALMDTIADYMIYYIYNIYITFMTVCAQEIICIYAWCNIRHHGLAFYKRVAMTRTNNNSF